MERRKRRKCVMGIVLVCVVLALAAPVCIQAAEPIMRIYSDLSRKERKALLTTTGSVDVNNYSYTFYALNPEPIDIGLPGKYEHEKGNTVYSYSDPKRKATRYFRKLSNQNIQYGGGWYLAYTAEDEDGVYAVASYDGTARNVTVPKVLEGYPVRGIAVTNNRIYRINMQNRVEYIYGCQSAFLRWLVGCDAVKYIGSQAFQNCVSLKKLPMMENLTTIATGAFEGCLSLTDIPLGDNIESISPDAFGWYDVVIGNYDFPGMNDEFSYYDGFLDNDRIYGVTLYARENSPTHWLLNNMYEYHYIEGMETEKVEFFTGHVSYGDLSDFTGVEEEPYKESGWTRVPYYDWTKEDQSAKDNTGNADTGNTGEGTASKPTAGLDDEAKSALDYLLDLFKKGAITFNALLFAMLTMFGVKVPNWVTKSLDQADMKGLAAFTKKCDGMTEAERLDMLNVATGYLGTAIGELEDYLPRGGTQYSLACTALASLIQAVSAAKNGQSLEDAIARFATNFGGTVASDTAIKIATGAIAVPGLKLSPIKGLGTWETVVSIGLGGSQAGDAAGITSNVIHLTDFMYDIVKASKAADTRAATDIIVDNALNKGTYGTNIQTAAQLLDITKNDDWDMVVAGIREMGTRKFLEGICETANHVCLDNNFFGQMRVRAFKNSFEGKVLMKAFNLTIQKLEEKGLLDK